MKRFVIIDSHAIIHRAFHALPPLTAPDGTPVNAVYGFASMLLRILREFSPHYLVAAFDSEGPTFRHIAFERYKAERQKAPDALYQQIPLVRELVAAFGIPTLELAGYEADDIIGTIVTKLRAHQPDLDIVIVTGDLDTLQLVDARTKVSTMRKGVADTVIYDEQADRERYGLAPSQLVDWKGLRGDPSDNIPGVRGIGEKTASELLHAHGSIEALYQALRKGGVEAKPAALEALRKSEADALFSKSLVTIERNVPIRFTLAQARFRKRDTGRDSVRTLFERLGFKSLIARLNGAGERSIPTARGDQQLLRSSVRVTEQPSLDAIRGGKHRLLLIDLDRDRALVATGSEDVVGVPVRSLSDAGEWFSKKHPTYCMNLKSLVSFGVPTDPLRVRDLSILWWLLEPDRRSFAVDELSRKIVGVETADPPVLAAALYRAAPILEERLKHEGLEHVYDLLEAPVIPILTNMEKVGIGFDPKPLTALATKMKQEIGALEESIFRAAGGPFNINSTRQLSEILFDKLHLVQKGIRKTEKGGVLSTRESELAKLKSAHPIVGDILRWRELSKLKSTYVDTLPDLIGTDKRIHTTWVQTGTATGRLSSREPNLQNIPIRGEYGPEIRKAFVASRGWAFVAFDYSQLELRIAADLSQDEKMIDAFRHGLDIHAMTAAETNNISLQDVTPELRQKAKVLNFGVLYGMGSRAFAEAAGISLGEAEVFIEEYFHDFSGIRRFVEQTKLQAREKKFTVTAFGHKRFYPDIETSNFRLQREFERMAVNHPIQGTEGGIMKKAMIEVDRYLSDRKLRDSARLLLQIHDELVYEIRSANVSSISRKIKELMEGIWAGSVKMRVEVKQGKNWGVLM